MAAVQGRQGVVRDWRAWLQLILALVPIIGAVGVATIFALNENKAIAGIQVQAEPIQLGWELQQMSASVSTALTSIEAAAQPDAGALVIDRATQDKDAAVAALDMGLARATELADSIAADLDTDVQAFRDILQESLGMTSAAFSSQQIGAPPSRGLAIAVDMIEERFAVGGNSGTLGWDTEANFLISVYSEVASYQNAWLQEHRALVRASRAGDGGQALVAALGDANVSATRNAVWDDLRIVLGALSSTESYQLVDNGTALVDPADELTNSLRARVGPLAQVAQGTDAVVLSTQRREELLLEGLALSDLASADLQLAVESLNASAQARVQLERRQQVIYIGAAALLVFVGLALLVLTRNEIRRRQRIERAHEAALQKLDTKASRDPMTGVWNRRRLDDQVAELLAAREEVGDLVLAYVDLDRFKTINDVWGHHTGDEVLKIAARRLEAVTADAAPIEVVRSGGDEFVCYVPLKSPDPATVSQFGADLIAAACEPMSIGGRTHRLGATAGLSVADPDATQESLMFEADSSLLLAKRNRRGTAAVYDRTLSRATELVKALPEALSSGEILCWYQPVFNLATGSLSHVEALARWFREDGSVVRPDEFIPLIESFGMASQLTDVALRNASEQQRRSGGRRTWINVTPGELDVSDFAERFLQSAQRENVQPELLGVEITETAAVSDPLNFSRQLAQLRAQGIVIAIDDFGNGYSPLGYLQDLPIDVVKLDRALIDRIDTSVGNQHIVRGIVALCRELGIETVAEGVERVEEYEWIADAAIDHVQGFLTARPMPAAELDWDFHVSPEATASQ